MSKLWGEDVRNAKDSQNPARPYLNFEQQHVKERFKSVRAPRVPTEVSTGEEKSGTKPENRFKIPWVKKLSKNGKGYSKEPQSPLG